MNEFMQSSGPQYPCDVEPQELPPDGIGPSVPGTIGRVTEAPAVANVGHHICTPRAEYGGRCWCQPRELITAMLQQSLLATERRLRPDNVVQFPVRARIKGRFSA